MFPNTFPGGFPGGLGLPGFPAGGYGYGTGPGSGVPTTPGSGTQYEWWQSLILGVVGIVGQVLPGGGGGGGLPGPPVVDNTGGGAFGLPPVFMLAAIGVGVYLLVRK